MYILTKLNLTAKEMVATRDLRCAYCGPNDGSVKKIKPGEEFFWIEGARRYDHFGRGFIPYDKRKECRRKGIKPDDYFEPITHHQMCPECFKKLRLFFYCSEQKKKDDLWIFDGLCDMTYPTSKYDYGCICCNGGIKAGDKYVRRGNAGGINTVCLDCYGILRHIIRGER